MVLFLRNLALVLRFRGALTSLWRDCGWQAVTALQESVFAVGPAGELYYVQPPFFFQWDAQGRRWSEELARPTNSFQFSGDRGTTVSHEHQKNQA